MAKSSTVAVFLEVGKKRTFAGAIDWPGWCRSGRDADAALEALAEAGRRYGSALRGTRLGFEAPKGNPDFSIRERVKGDATTDFGAPSRELKDDAAGVSERELKRLSSFLRAGWRALDRAVAEAEGRELRKGPRGGGRSLEAIVRHVLEAEAGYLGALGWKTRAREAAQEIREEVIAGLRASVAGEIPKRGPRGGKRWVPRYFVRRTVWHALDHAWEIEDRAT